jgi:hypothetical protein
MSTVGIASSKSTHAGRKTGAQQAEILGVPESEVSNSIFLSCNSLVSCLS